MSVLYTSYDINKSFCYESNNPACRFMRARIHEIELLLMVGGFPASRGWVGKLKSPGIC